MKFLKKRRRAKWKIFFYPKQKKVFLSFGNALHAEKYIGRDRIMKE
jgi:hypothetical protein